MPKKYMFSQEEIEHALKTAWFTDRERKICTLFYVRGWRIEDIAPDINNGMSRRMVSYDLVNIRKKIIEAWDKRVRDAGNNNQ